MKNFLEINKPVGGGGGWNKRGGGKSVTGIYISVFREKSLLFCNKQNFFKIIIFYSKEIIGFHFLWLFSLLVVCFGKLSPGNFLMEETM